MEARQHTASSVLSTIAAPVAPVRSIACSKIAWSSGSGPTDSLPREVVIGLNWSALCSTFRRGFSGELVILELSGKGKLDILTPSR